VEKILGKRTWVQALLWFSTCSLGLLDSGTDLKSRKGLYLGPSPTQKSKFQFWFWVLKISPHLDPFLLTQIGTDGWLKVNLWFNPSGSSHDCLKLKINNKVLVLVPCISRPQFQIPFFDKKIWFWVWLRKPDLDWIWFLLIRTRTGGLLFLNYGAFTLDVKSVLNEKSRWHPRWHIMFLNRW
jgi:hypothetical protein